MTPLRLFRRRTITRGMCLMLAVVVVGGGASRRMSFAVEQLLLNPPDDNSGATLSQQFVPSTNTALSEHRPAPTKAQRIAAPQVCFESGANWGRRFPGRPAGLDPLPFAAPLSLQSQSVRWQI